MPRGGARPGAGAPAKPLEEHLRDGTYRPDRHGPAAGVRPADGKRPPSPDGLTDAMQTAWDVLLDDLEASALLDSADAPLYEAFAVAHGRAREARSLVSEHGMLIRGAREGTLVANPMLKVERESLTQLRYLADQLAIGMRARASLGIAIARGSRGSGKPGAGPGESPRSSGGIGPSPRLVGLSGGGDS